MVLSLVFFGIFDIAHLLVVSQWRAKQLVGITLEYKALQDILRQIGSIRPQEDTDLGSATMGSRCPLDQGFLRTQALQVHRRKVVVHSWSSL